MVSKGIEKEANDAFNQKALDAVKKLPFPLQQPEADTTTRS